MAQRKDGAAHVIELRNFPPVPPRPGIIEIEHDGSTPILGQFLQGQEQEIEVDGHDGARTLRAPVGNLVAASKASALVVGVVRDAQGRSSPRATPHT